MSKIKSKGNSNSKTFHEEESQNPSPAEVSLDNADTVIQGGPAFRVVCEGRVPRLPVTILDAN